MSTKQLPAIRFISWPFGCYDSLHLSKNGSYSKCDHCENIRIVSNIGKSTICLSCLDDAKKSFNILENVG